MTASDNLNTEPTAGCQPDATCEGAAAREQHTRDMDRRVAVEHTEALLDEALDETFPASDSVSITPRKPCSK